MEKTDLSKILSVSGYPGLYLYLAQSRTGVIAQALSDGKKSNFPAAGRMTTLEDIAIYTDGGEMKLRNVFEAMHKVLADAAAPSPKAGDDALKTFFAKAVPSYDGDRFYVSHMKKVVGWYNELKDFASLDFVNPDEEAEKNSAETAPETAVKAAPAKAKAAPKAQAKPAVEKKAKAAPKAAAAKTRVTAPIKAGGK